MKKAWLYVQLGVVAAGCAFAWTTLLGNFRAFLGLYGTLWRFADCSIPNPLITPCFYGAVAFAGALLWAGYALQSGSVRSQQWLRWFLLFGVVFAGGVVVQEALHYYQVISGPKFACDPNLVAPWQTPCFTGGVFYLASFAVSLVAYTKLRVGEGA